MATQNPATGSDSVRMEKPVTLQKAKTLGRFDIFLAIIVYVLFLDTLAPAAAMGPSVITWCLIIALLYFIPASLLISEQGSAYPNEGGLYTWVKIGMGDRWAARTSWYYWLNNAIWIPSVTVFIAQVIAQLFAIDMSLRTIIIIAIAVTWIYVVICVRPMKESKWVINIGGVFKLAIIGFLAIAATVYLTKNGTPVNTMAFSDFVPTIGASFAFFPALIYNLNGCEAICTMGGQMKNPAKDVPRNVITAAIIIVVLNCLAAWAILSVVPYEGMDVVQGLLNCLIFSFGEGAFARFIVVLVGLMFLYTLMASGPAWVNASCIMASEAAHNGELPKFFGKMHSKHQTPIGALIIIGSVATVILIVYGLMAGSAEDLFWSLFSFTVIIYFLPYIINCSAFIRLRKNDPDTPRPYRFPGSNGFAFFVCRLGQLILIFTIISFFWAPGLTIDWAYTLPVVIGAVIFLIIGEILNTTAMKKHKG